ncbi:MAG: translocation protein TolB [Gammaproteobacteria bacterium SG8_47]|nr:MAG: translocation protein TolB [Gammaproteobacteria bacterium SG8_47]
MLGRMLSALFVAIVLVMPARAELTIQISEGVEGSLPIAVVPFGFEGRGAAPADIAAIVAADLRRSGRFQPLPREDMVGEPHEAQQVNFQSWRAVGTDNVVVGKLRALADGSYQVQFQLLDALRGKQLAGYSIPSRPDQLRQTAHQISDIIYETLTGQRGAFDTFIAYVVATGKGTDKATHRLAVADADGYGEQTILESTQPVMSPAWAPDGKRLAYVSFNKGRPAVYVQNVVTQEVRVVAEYPGLNNAPAWSPDGKRLALTLSKDGNPEIYVVDMATLRLQRITRHYAIDTEPAWAADGRELFFTSDRGGSPQIYRVRLDASGAATRPQRLTFEGRYNARASVSPDGKHIAVVHGADGKYRIAVQELNTGILRVLTDARLDESPSFAPNGAMIIYATEENGRGVLAAVSIDGRSHQRLSLQSGDVREPAWSPFKRL